MTSALGNMGGRQEEYSAQPFVGVFWADHKKSTFHSLIGLNALPKKP